MATSFETSADGRAVQYVIKTVDSLCDEFSTTSENTSVAQLVHLELSMAKILDELEIPSVERAKHEVALLAQLSNGLSRLIKHSKKTLQSPGMVKRLNRFRKETQKLLRRASESPAKNQELKAKDTESEIEHTLSSTQPSDNHPSIVESTKTPAETETTTEVPKVGQDFEAQVDALATLVVEDSDKPNVMKSQLKRSRSIADQMEEAAEDVKEQTVSDHDSTSFGWLLMVIGIIAVSLVLLRSMPSFHQLGRLVRGGYLESVAVSAWEMACELANEGCKKYDYFCTKYCASGLQISKWKRSR